MCLHFCTNQGLQPGFDNIIAKGFICSGSDLRSYKQVCVSLKPPWRGERFAPEKGSFITGAFFVKENPRYSAAASSSYSSNRLRLCIGISAYSNQIMAFHIFGIKNRYNARQWHLSPRQKCHKGLSGELCRAGQTNRQAGNDLKPGRFFLSYAYPEWWALNRWSG